MTATQQQRRERELDALLGRCARALDRRATPAQALIFWSLPAGHLKGRRPCDLARDHDLEGLRLLSDLLESDRA